MPCFGGNQSAIAHSVRPIITEHEIWKMHKWAKAGMMGFEEQTQCESASEPHEGIILQWPPISRAGAFSRTYSVLDKLTSVTIESHLLIFKSKNEFYSSS
ncbi:unnamed protein product [Sphenostylis stenocarpa]|uniref:Uncharacterized protein n=1 Tax=Sphenostylis stenocarpa TaxID=92480 RepID=A0AA86W0V3_9FABA|nr:unnamed protein product [Sphenostylis stenocarpa]